jgi:hypothetical protein
MEQYTFPTKVVGVTFGDAQKSITLIEPNDVLILTKEPSNPYDANAIQVSWRGNHIGYLNKELASKLAQHKDETWTAKALEVTGRDKGTLGLNIEIKVTKNE